METFDSSVDFAQIKEQAHRQAQRISSLKSELKQLLAPNTQEKPTKPPLSQSKPVMLTRMNRIQTKLSQLAAALSPSSRSTPMSRGVSGNSPRTQFEVATPRADDSSSSSSDGDEFFNICKTQISSKVASIERNINQKLSELQAQKDELENLRVQLSLEADAKEKMCIAKLADAVALTSCNQSDSTSELVNYVNEEISKVKLSNERLIADAIESAEKESRVVELLEELKSEFQRDNEAQLLRLKEGVSRSIRTKLADSMKDIRDHYDGELSKLSNLMHDNQSANEPLENSGPIQRLKAENDDLKRTVRRLKICLAKWRMDYLKHVPRVDAPVTTTAYSPHGGQVNLGEHYSELARTLGRMWEATPPSGTELIGFLARIEESTSHAHRVTLSDILKDECSRQVEKLPIAELAARREFLLAKPFLDNQDCDELDMVTHNLLSLIAEYEDRHGLKFVYDGEEYLTRIQEV